VFPKSTQGVRQISGGNGGRVNHPKTINANDAPMHIYRRGAERLWYTPRTSTHGAYDAYHPSFQERELTGSPYPG
jgi:hypothetical protein